jgi:hypothetical protein
LQRVIQVLDELLRCVGHFGIFVCTTAGVPQRRIASISPLFPGKKNGRYMMGTSFFRAALRALAQDG